MTPIPTFSDIKDQIVNNLASEFGFSGSFGRLFLVPFAYVIAAIFKLVYLAIGMTQRNVAPDLADIETLIRYGNIKLGRGPYPAVQGQYEIDITINQAGTIPESTTWKTDDTASNPGKLYVLDNDFVVGPGTFPGLYTVTVRALEPGTESTMTGGDSLTATAPIAIANSEAVYSSVVVAPLAAEDIEEYRSKVLQSYRQEPQGGATTDYRLWGSDAAGVKQIYPYAKSGATNEVNIFVEANEADSLDGHGTPGGPILVEVASCIEQDPDTTLPISDRARRPMGVIPHVLPIVTKPVDITITGYVGSTPAIVATILQAVTEYIDLIRPFIDGADVLADKNDTITQTGIITAIVNAVPGSIFSSLAMSVDSTPVVFYEFDNGEIPFLNGIIYV